MERVEEHARHFVSLVERLLRDHEEKFGEKGIIVAPPYDTELFGHWWFEGGVKWLGRVLELLHQRGGIETPTLSRFLEKYSGEKHEIELPEGSWGGQTPTIRHGGTRRLSGHGRTYTRGGQDGSNSEPLPRKG